jgi:hypothetical protein
LYSKTQWRSTTFSSLPDGTRILWRQIIFNGSFIFTFHSNY